MDIPKKIDEINDDIKNLNESIIALQSKRDKSLSQTFKTNFQNEIDLENIKLNSLKNEMKNLRFENLKTSIFSICLFILILLIIKLFNFM
jgi:hypothetical protein